jgi:hypothetical protein
LTDLPSILQIVPRVPPAVDGVGDYAFSLAHGLRTEFGLQTRFLVCSDAGHVLQRTPVFPAARLAKWDRREFVRVMGSLVPRTSARKQTMALHYSGYGYARDGAPKWLVEGLEELLRTRSDLGLVTIFHELFATGKPWRRAYWHTARQRELAMRLRMASMNALCTTERNEGILKSWAADRPLARISIPSGIGEPAIDAVGAWSAKRSSLVVFGRRHSRELAYRNREALETVCRRLSIDRIVDIGPEMPRLPKLAIGPIETCGTIAAEKVSGILAMCRYGYLCYAPDDLAKSSVFAAYSAHGVATIIPATPGASRDGLQKGRHYASADGFIGEALPRMELIAQCAQDWYQSHATKVHVAWLAQACASELEIPE